MLDEKKLLSKDPFEDIYGLEDVKRELKSTLIVGRHIILVGAPGTGKTTLAKNVAKLLPDIEVNDCEFHCNPGKPLCPECKKAVIEGKKVKIKKIAGKERFVRIQGSPDLSAEDLLGDIDPIKAMKHGPLSIEAFTPGKIFLANQGILFFDEVNRCSEKLQNSLLQVLEEGFATIGSYKVELPANFVFIGTMNPNDASTEKLSDVFLDRFDLVYVGYPETLEIEKRIVVDKSEKVPGITFPENLLNFTVSFVRELRDNDKLEKVPSVRASIGLYERALANAKIDGRQKVEYDDIRQAMKSVLSHRIELKPSVRYLQRQEDFVEEEIEKFTEKNGRFLSDDKGGDG